MKRTSMPATALMELMLGLSATVTAPEAIATVEKASGGKVIELALDRSTATPAYMVTVAAADGSETNHLVDATTGKATVTTDTAGNDAQDQAEGANEGQETGSETGDINWW